MDKPKKIEIAKTITKFVVGRSVSYVIYTALKNAVEPESKLQKAELAVGATVAGYMVADAAEDYTDKTIDSVVEAFENVKSNIQAARQ